MSADCPLSGPWSAVSSLADPVSPSARRRRTITIPIPDVSGSAGLATGVAIAVAAASFAAAGGLRLERTTQVLIAMMLAGAGARRGALLRRPRTAEWPLYGGGPLLAFAVLAVFTALLDAVVAHAGGLVDRGQPHDGLPRRVRRRHRAGAPAARAAGPGWWPASGSAACWSASWALLTKVFPASLAPDETYARLREPFAYWNSVGLMAALGVPPMLWLAARRSGHAAVNALAWPAMAILFVCLMLSYSRGALAALVIGVALWMRDRAAAPARARRARGRRARRARR